MSCKHENARDLASVSWVSWCPRCGALREGSEKPWQLSEHEQHEIALESMCPICEFGHPLPVETKDGKKIFRWTCKHWINEGPLGAPRDS